MQPASATALLIQGFFWDLTSIALLYPVSGGIKGESRFHGLNRQDHAERGISVIHRIERGPQVHFQTYFPCLATHAT